MLGLGGYRIEEGDMLAHARSLAMIVQNAKRGDGWWRKPPEPWPTMRLLLEMLSRAKLFVHFTNWGISHVLIVLTERYGENGQIGLLGYWRGDVAGCAAYGVRCLPRSSGCSVMTTE